MGLEYLKTFSSKATVSSYRQGIKTFLRSIYNVEITNGDLELSVSKYLSESRNRQEDLETFLASIKDRPPKNS